MLNMTRDKETRKIERMIENYYGIDYKDLENVEEKGQNIVLANVKTEDIIPKIKDEDKSLVIKKIDGNVVTRADYNKNPKLQRLRRQ